MGRFAPLPDSCTTGAVVLEVDELPTAPHKLGKPQPEPKPITPPTVSSLHRVANWPTPPRKTQVCVGVYAKPRRGITMVFVAKLLFRPPFRPRNKIEPLALVGKMGVLGTGLGMVGSNPPALLYFSLDPPCVSERNPRLTVKFRRNLRSS